jgi:hypothetical protein
MNFASQQRIEAAARRWHLRNAQSCALHHALKCWERERQLGAGWAPLSSVYGLYLRVVCLWAELRR